MIFLKMWETSRMNLMNLKKNIKILLDKLKYIIY